jgi:hypothetical protein
MTTLLTVAPTPFVGSHVFGPVTVKDQGFTNVRFAFSIDAASLLDPNKTLDILVEKSSDGLNFSFCCSQDWRGGQLGKNGAPEGAPGITVDLTSLFGGQARVTVTAPVQLNLGCTITGF